VTEAEPTTQVLPPEERGSSRLGSIVRKGAPLVAAGAIGAGIAVGIGAAVDGGTTTTIIQAASPAATASTAASSQGGQASVAAQARAILSVQTIYERSAPGVVQITAVSNVQGADPLNPFGGQQEHQQSALGSGFVIDKAGHIVTNYHVVQGAQEVEVNFSGRAPVRAKIVGSDPSTDIAVLEVQVPANALTPLPLGDSDQVHVGDPVVAIGNPFGLDRTVTAGIVSALQREIAAPNGFPIDHVIQTDASINHGNSGGPLLNARGEVIGVNSQIQSGGVDGNVGIGFAVPINTVKEIASQLIETGKVERAFLGIEMQTISPDAARTLHLPTENGVLIESVRPGSPAAKAGLRGGDSTQIVGGETWILGGDIITRADGRAVATADQLRDIVLSKRPGDTLELELNREGTTINLSIQLGRQPTTPTG
jgi:S1-C subfamily serine protease